MQGPMRTANNTNGATSYSHRPVWIVTDSTADIPDGMANDLPITIVPLTVEVGGRSYRDGIDLSRDEFVGMSLSATKTDAVVQRLGRAAVERDLVALVEAHGGGDPLEIPYVSEAILGLQRGERRSAARER